MSMTIRFLKNYGRHKAGDVRVVEDAHAADFIERGFAVDATPPPEPEPEPTQEAEPSPTRRSRRHRAEAGPDQTEDN